jgi:hypothetical protein
MYEEFEPATRKFPVVYQCRECGFNSGDEFEADQHETDTDHAVLDFELDPSDILN